MDSISRILFARYLGILMDAAVGVVIAGDLISMDDDGAPFVAWNLLDGTYSTDYW